MLDAGNVRDLLLDYLSAENTSLFGGAGIGVRTGLPSWHQYLEHLADAADNYNKLDGALIRQRASKNQFVAAASVFKTSVEIPNGKKFELLASPFTGGYSSNKLNSLLTLPFTSIITTNFDRAIHDAYADVMGKSPATVELWDPTMRTAPFWNDFYIARIHGRVEVPDSMILDEADYARATQNPDYINFFRHLMTRRKLLFVGYSFVDPAIQLIIDLLKKQLGPNYPSLHTALISSDADEALLAQLREVNIEPHVYNADK